MFGYVQPLVPELRVRENEAYRAVYCGLCRAMGRRTGCASRLTLSYDFVYLCVFRAALTKTAFSFSPHRCAVHPCHARIAADECEPLAYCARAAAVLTYEKLRDDLGDERGAKRAAARAVLPFAARMRRRAGDTPFDAELTAALGELSRLESENAASLDETAACSGRMLAAICAAGLDGTAARIAREAGDAVGRFVYFADAADDAPDDAARDRYNPITAMYGTDIFETREAAAQNGAKKPRPRLRLELADKLYTAALCELTRLGRAVELIDFSGVQPEIEGILKNVAYLGMPAELRRVLALA